MLMDTGASPGDPRISKYREAVLAIEQGRLDALEIPDGSADEVGELGSALRSLAAFLRSRLSEMDALAQATQKVLAGVTLDEVLNHIYETFRPVIPYDRIGYAVLEDGGRAARLVWVRSELPTTGLPQGYRMPLRGSSLEALVETGWPRILNNLERHLEERPDSDSTRRLLGEGLRSSLTCLLTAEGQPAGFLFFSSRHSNAYRKAHVELFLQLAGELSFLIERGRSVRRLLEMNEALGMAVHDLRGPVAIIKVGLAALRRSPDLTERQEDLIEQIQGAAESLKVLIDDLLDLSMLGADRLDLNRSRVNLEEFLRNCYSVNLPLARAKSMELRLDPSPPLPPVPLDPRRIRQVLDNLIGNAVKFSDPGTAIRLGARPHPRGVEFFVGDQGPGIAPEDQERIFTPFARGRAQPTGSEKSTGLGLAISRRIVEAHGGELWVDSTRGQGSVFRFFLPGLSSPLSP